MQPLKLLTRDHPHALETRDAAMRPRTFDATANTIEAVIATDAAVPRHDARGAYLEILDVAGADLDALRGASVLDSHNQRGLDAVLGTVDEAWREGTKLVARIRLSSRPEVAALIEDVRAGVIQHLSIGYEVAEFRDGTDASGKRTRTAVKWSPREVSFVPVSADPAARTRSRQYDRPATGRATINRSIRELARRAGVTSQVVDDLIDNESSVEEARTMIFDDLLTRGRLPIRAAHNDHTVDNPDMFVRAAAEALHVRIAPDFNPSGAARQFVGMTIPDLARECLRRNGINVTALAADALVTRALHTTSDFALILADTVNRTLRESYTAAPSGIRQLARQTTAADFRAKSRLMLDSSGFTLEKVNEAGEFKSGSMAEAAESYAVDSYGRIFGISRKALVNDNLGAFTDLTRRLGQATAAFEAQFLVNLLQANSATGPVMSDTKALFHADHGNIGAGVDWQSANPEPLYGLDVARLAMRKQTGISGELISVTPKYVLIPSELETVGEQILSAIQATTVVDVNPFSRLTLIVEPRLADVHRWYVVAAPTEIDGLEYAYLAGAPGPQTESRAGFEVDGVQIKVRLDYGAGFVDWRGWYTNPGQ